MFSNGECDREKYRTTMHTSLTRLHMQTVIMSPNAVLSAQIASSLISSRSSRTKVQSALFSEVFAETVVYLDS
jgi:hypothetical protein